MPTRKKITAEIIEQALSTLRQCYNDLYIYQADTLLLVFIPLLYETAIIVASGIDEYASFKNYKVKLPDSKSNGIFARLRNDLVHNFFEVDDIIEYVCDKLESFGRENFVFTCKLCNLDGSMCWELLFGMRTKEVTNIPLVLHRRCIVEAEKTASEYVQQEVNKYDT